MSTRLPPIESLRVLEACVRHGNFTRAANEIGVTPAAVSLRIRNLESDLGAKLFHRSGPRLTPTARAVELAHSVAEAMQLMRDAVDDCRRHITPLRLTAVPSFASRWLAPRMRRYHERHGDVPIRLDSSMDVREPDNFDMAIRTGSGHWANLDVTPLMPVEATAMLSPRLAASVRLSSPADLLQLPLLAHDDWPRWFREAGVHESALRYSADEYPTHELDAAAAVEGAGVALLSPTLFGSLIADGKLVQPFEHVMRGPAWHYFLHRPGDARPQVLDFRVWLQSELRSSAARTGGI